MSKTKDWYMQVTQGNDFPENDNINDYATNQIL